jgi:hypothetical protein
MEQWNIPVVDAEIYSISGIPVARFQFIKGEALVGLNNFTPGIYFFRICGPEKCTMGSFIKIAL